MLTVQVRPKSTQARVHVIVAQRNARYEELRFAVETDKESSKNQVSWIRSSRLDSTIGALRYPRRTSL